MNDTQSHGVAGREIFGHDPSFQFGKGLSFCPSELL